MPQLSRPEPPRDWASLIELFYPEDQGLLGAVEPVADESVPPPYHGLLVHNAHMTVTVERFHGQPITVEVLRSLHYPPIYQREIVLHLEDGTRCVQYGIVYMRCDLLSDPQAAEEIIREQLPLGRILISHDVMRQVQPLEYFSVRCGEELARHFGCPVDSTTFGRTAIIHCDGQPAIWLLEIVAPEPTSDV